MSLHLKTPLVINKYISHFTHTLMILFFPFLSAIIRQVLIAYCVSDYPLTRSLRDFPVYSRIIQCGGFKCLPNLPFTETNLSGCPSKLLKPWSASVVFGNTKSIFQYSAGFPFTGKAGQFWLLLDQILCSHKSP